MDCSTQVNFVKVENQNEFDWLYLEELLNGALELPLTLGNSFNDQYSMNNFVDFDPSIFPNRSTHFDFKDFEDVLDDFGVPTFLEDLEMDVKPLMNSMREINGGSFLSVVPNVTQREVNGHSGRACKSSTLELDEIKKYFDVPISKAAKELKVGLTVLKKRCRELNIMRWPHRKIKSLKSLIDNVKEMGLTSEIAVLEEHKRMLEKIPELELTERTKKLRQACFKANYKKRRSQPAFY